MRYVPAMPTQTMHTGLSAIAAGWVLTLMGFGQGGIWWSLKKSSFSCCSKSVVRVYPATSMNNGTWVARSRQKNEKSLIQYSLTRSMVSHNVSPS